MTETEARATATSPASRTTGGAIDAERWRSRLAALAGEHRVVGASLAVLRVAQPGADGADELVEAATGLLDVTTGAPVTTASVFQTDSITEVWTATLVVQLVEEGLLDLDAPVRAVLPGLRLADEAVALVQEHSTGLPDAHPFGDSWGLGWIRYGWGGHRLYGHDGSTLGQNGFLRVLPGARLVVSLLTDGGDTVAFARAVLTEVFAGVAGVEVPSGIAPHLFAVRPEGSGSWSAVTSCSVDGERYAHTGARATPGRG